MFKLCFFLIDSLSTNPTIRKKATKERYMVVFHQHLTARDQDYTFRFHRILNPEGDKYFVEVLKDEMRITSFEMKQTTKAWYIVPPVPEWIMELEAQLRKIIEDYMVQD